MATNNLFGTGSKQVPQNVNLGGMAYQNPDYVKIKNLEVDYISQIQTDIPESVVDVFVYDTSKDSDGGAWRKRTTHTSWYNETLNTATRGSRREFPAVAVLVLYASGEALKIYDGDDPDLPMWMDFANYSGRNYFYGTGRAPKVKMLNGMFVTGSQATNFWPIMVDFIRDSCVGLRSSGGNYDHGANIAGRNTLDSSNDHYWVHENRNTKKWYFDGHIANQKVNDVAITVLPNAPISVDTGLPIPTVALASDNGVSIIKDNGTILDLFQNHANANHANFVDFDSKTNAVIWTTDYQPEGTAEVAYKLNVNPIPNSDQVTGNGVIGPYQNWNRTIQSGGNLTKPKLKGHPMTDVISNGGDGCYAISTGNNYNGNTLNLLKEYYGSVPGSTSNVNALIAYIGHDYNTGWMRGEARAAWLSSTDTTDATASELILDGSNWAGDFDSSNDLNAWTTVVGGTATVTGGLLKLTDTSGSFVYASAPFTTVIGKKYVVSFESVNNSNTATYSWVRIGNSHNATEHHNTNYGGSYGIKSVYFTATATTTYITLISGLGANTFGHWDNVSAKPVEEDRSDKNKGLQVFGTVTKSPVAPGSELVAYSGFSSSNYLQQPYNSDLDFAADDFSISFWYKSTTTIAACVLHRGDGGLNPGWGTGKIIQIEFNSTNLAAFLAESAFTGFDTVVIPQAKAADGNWHHYMLVRSNEFVGVYWDGILQDETRSTRNLSNTEARTWVGERPNNTRPLVDTSLTLLRITANAPTEEQIKYMYQSEKMLFTDNSNCTLYGTSDEVTAMAHDEGTGVLHVGTSGGRSDFQGLCRINNTTTAVTTAISAHDGFIVEQ